MRNRRAACRSNESGGFYTPDFLIAGGIAIGIATMLVVIGRRMQLTWLLVIAAFLYAIGVTLMVVEYRQFAALRREQREREERPPPKP